MTDYTPTSERVRDRYAHCRRLEGQGDQASAEFDRWLAARDRQVRAEALREFAAFIDSGPTFDLPPSVFSAMARERADDIEGGEE